MRLLVAGPVPGVERPWRGEAHQRKAHRIGPGTHTIAQREFVPQPDILDQHDVAGFEIARREFVQVFRQLDEMVLHIEQPVQRLDAGKALAQRFRLAIADDDELAAPGTRDAATGGAPPRTRSSAIGSSSLIRSTEFDLQRRRAEMVQPDVERRVRPGFERQIERHGKIERNRSAAEARRRRYRAAPVPPRSSPGRRASSIVQLRLRQRLAPNTSIPSTGRSCRRAVPHRALHNQPELPARQPQIRPSAVKQASRRLVSRHGHAAAAACAGQASSCPAGRAAASGCSLPGPAPPPAAFRDRPN